MKEIKWTKKTNPEGEKAFNLAELTILYPGSHFLSTYCLSEPL